MKTDEWLTPPKILRALGHFDLDPRSPINRPWKTADKHYTRQDDGMSKPWKGRIWCNPPYGREAEKWLERMADHGNGTALIFARTETKMFFSQVWERATSVLFIQGRIHFHLVDGTKSVPNSGAPSVLIAYGESDSEILELCRIPGKYLHLK